jgi:hypothetical protein
VSRNKGNVAEREVAKLIATWWSQLEPEATFIRTPLSGGWSTANVRASFKASGDLMTTATYFPFDVEIKRREEWTHERLFEGRPSPVWEWWLQCQRAAAEGDRVPMLWARRSREPWLMILPFDFAYDRGMFGCTPRRVWSTTDLLSINVGEHHPICFDAADILGVDPTVFI